MSDVLSPLAVIALALVLAHAPGCDSELTPDDGGVIVDGYLVEAYLGGDPFADGAGEIVDLAPPYVCDDTVGDFTACNAFADGGADPGNCLSPALCQLLAQSLEPRLAGYAMDCVNNYGGGCDPSVPGGCLLSSALQACVPAAPGTPPCDTVATLCADGDPYGTVDECLSMAAGLTPSAVSALQSCLQGDGGACDPGALLGCAATLFPSPAGDM